MSEQATRRAHAGLWAKFDYYVLTAFGMLHLKFKLANVVCSILPDFASGVLRGRLYRLAGFSIEPGSFIMGNLHLPSGQGGFYAKLSIGPNVVIGDHVTINLDGDVHLGRNAALGPRVLIYTGTHQIGPGSKRRVGGVIVKPVRIEEGCSIGLAALILPGVTIGRGSVVAAGAVVTQDVPPNSFVEGNPARVVHKLPWGDR